MYDRLSDKEIAYLEAKGFRRWTKAGMDRLYVPATKLGLEIRRYKSGNIASATFNGEPISNSDARRLMDAKTYLNVSDSMIHSTDDRLFHAAVEIVANAIACGGDPEVEAIIMAGYPEPDDSDDDDEEYIPSATAGDYSPNCPWKAPGMRVSDFIR